MRRVHVSRSAVVRQAMASCAGMVVCVSRGAAVDDYVATLINMYNERGAEDAAVRMCVEVAMKECMLHAGDVMRDHYSTVSTAWSLARACSLTRMPSFRECLPYVDREYFSCCENTCHVD